MTQYLGMPNDNEIMSPTWCTRSQLCSRRYSCRSSLAAAYELARSGSPRHKPENECDLGKCQKSQWVFYQTSVVRIGSRLTESRPPTMNSFSVWVRSWDHGSRDTRSYLAQWLWEVGHQSECPGVVEVTLSPPVTPGPDIRWCVDREHKRPILVTIMGATWSVD